MATYLTYPFKTMTITQSYTGSTSHYPHTKGNYRDYPNNEAGADYDRNSFYAPCRLKIVEWLMAQKYYALVQVKR